MATSSTTSTRSNRLRRRLFLNSDWELFALVLVMLVFNTVLGEELLFRGLLLPRMRGVFGRADWIANAVLFGLYHLHQPWSIPSSVAVACCRRKRPGTAITSRAPAWRPLRYSASASSRHASARHGYPATWAGGVENRGGTACC
jgi:Type II CAAX prenyl endopeptidase Rce1-like